MNFLYARGYTHLYGYDYDPKSIEAAKMISASMNFPIEYDINDATCPRLNEMYKVIVCISGMYILPNYSLDIFLNSHIQYLDEGGYFVFDMIDKSFNYMMNNEYSTQDWGKPLEERRPSEYLIWMSEEEIRSVATRFGLELKMFRSLPGVLPYDVVVLKKY